MVDLINDLATERWMDKGQPPPDPSKMRDYKAYTLYQRQVQESTDYMTYYLKTDDGDPLKVTLSGLSGGKRDPLKHVHNCYLKLAKKGEECYINGNILDRDWVEKK